MTEIHLPTFHQGQRAVYAQRKRFNWLSAGRRWRKTTLCMSVSVLGMIEGQDLLWGAPTYDQCRVGWEEFRHALGDAANFNESRMEIRIPRKGRILLRSLDNPDNARGHTADGAVLDEAADISPEAWHEVVRPMLIDTNGWAFIGGTPKGRNWFWAEHRKAADGENADSMAWQAPSLGVSIVDGALVRSPHPLENPELPFSEIQHLYHTLPERSFRQEILAEFVEDGGGVFRNVRKVSTVQPGEPQPGHVYVAGADWGRTADYTVVSIWDGTDKRQVYMDRFTGIDAITQINRIIALYERWQWDILLAELNSFGRSNVEYLQRVGVPVRGFEMTHGSKIRLIDNYALAFERQQFQLLNDQTQINEHEAFEQETMPGGLIRFKSPSGIHDDTIIAGALAWQMAQGQSDQPQEEELPEVPTILEAFPSLARFRGIQQRFEKGRSDGYGG